MRASLDRLAPASASRSRDWLRNYLESSAMGSRSRNTVIARHLLGLGLVATVCSCRNLPHSESTPEYDLVILNGTVMDPASGLDAPRNLGIADGVIRAIVASAMRGRDTIDASGMVVAPGFIDLHQHAQDTAGYRVEALDGTTTALELEGGTVDIDRWYDDRAGRAVINYGVSIGHEPVRMLVMHDPGEGLPERCGEASRRHARGTGGDCSDDRPWPSTRRRRRGHVD